MNSAIDLLKNRGQENTHSWLGGLFALLSREFEQSLGKIDSLRVKTLQVAIQI